MSIDDTREMRLSQRCIPVMQRILGAVFFSVAPLPMDREENTDLVVFEMQQREGGIRIAARVREWHFAERYPHDVTIRATRPHARTELDKMLDGDGDYMLYGFGRVDRGRIGVPRWIVVDLAQLRLAIHTDDRWFRSWSERLIPNADRSSHFVAIDAHDLRDRRCVVRTSEGYWSAPNRLDRIHRVQREQITVDDYERRAALEARRKLAEAQARGELPDEHGRAS